MLKVNKMRYLEERNVNRSLLSQGLNKRSYANEINKNRIKGL